MSEPAAPLMYSDPISLVIRRRVRPGQEEAYEGLVSEVGRQMASLPGYLGSGVVRPAPGERDYTLIARFSSAAAARAWEESPRRAEWLRRLDDVVEEQVSFEKQPGLELWFTAPPAQPVPQPPRWKTALLILAVLFPVAQAMGWLLAPHFLTWPPLLKALLQSAVVVTLMTYLLMPLATRLAGNWLKQ
ncbi:antibiotic biosynthesis monooxygenase [Deinococcus radiophilus]|uniref:Antibiotic biosynthesis monooxygenase n=1 Tax=Deinococcus radiophilus TaxID=32062 RepID=A0A431W1J8_9DEIO|nr:antibiotic biosynthesis monooxygenase [Deinococcus radiophilus]RTR29370.1 antibiotic biosynthesis monooxygenase [Deinococcus radiophilus]UFA50803.1 antibiotic biosynthesis monooxygenase [Deinococcus radiophilus]